MHNLVLLIGRLVNEPELVKTETGKKVLTIRLAVQRNFKNLRIIFLFIIIIKSVISLIIKRIFKHTSHHLNYIINP